jgi:hypothetical protein
MIYIYFSHYQLTITQWPIASQSVVCFSLPFPYHPRRRTEDVDPPYVYVGKQRPHYKAVTKILFGVQLDSNFPRLLSLGLDRLLVEYDLANSAKGERRDQVDRKPATVRQTMLENNITN